jgi:hypothetical protein
VLAISVIACNKKGEINQASHPATSTMARSLDFPIRGIKKDTNYANTNNIIASAGFSDLSPLGSGKNIFYLSFNAGPHVVNTVGDFILFQIEKASLHNGYVGTYSLDQQSAYPIKNARYVYAMRYANDFDTKGNIVEAALGAQMQGSLTIEKYDAVQNTISGSYTITANLNGDPTRLEEVVDVADQCTLRVSGTFSNVKINQD